MTQPIRFGDFAPWQRVRIIAGFVVALIAILLATMLFVQQRNISAEEDANRAAIVINSQAVAALSLREQALAHQQALQQQAFNGFLQHFVAEQNYVCSVVAQYAEANGLMTPPPNVCSVVLPSVPTTAAPTSTTPCATSAPGSASTSAPTARPTSRPASTSAPRSPPPRTPTPTFLLCSLGVCPSPVVLAACP